MRYVAKLGFGGMEKTVREYEAKSAVTGSNLIELQLLGDYTRIHGVNGLYVEFEDLFAKTDIDVVSIHTPLLPARNVHLEHIVDTEAEEHTLLKHTLMLAQLIGQKEQHDVNVVMHVENYMNPRLLELLLSLPQIEVIRNLMELCPKVKLIIENVSAIRTHEDSLAIAACEDYDMWAFADIVRKALNCKVGVLIDTCHAETTNQVLKHFNNMKDIYADGKRKIAIEQWRDGAVSAVHFSYAGDPGCKKANHGMGVTADTYDFLDEWFQKFVEQDNLMVILEIYEKDYTKPLNLESTMQQIRRWEQLNLVEVEKCS